MPRYQVSLGMTNGRGGLTHYPMGQIKDSSVNGYYLKTLNIIT